MTESEAASSLAVQGKEGLFDRKAVERHVTRIYDKLGTSTRPGAALCALDNGLP